MPDPKPATFAEPTFVTEDGTRALVWATPDGLIVRTRTKMGAESSASIPADVALVLLENAEQLRAALSKPEPSEG